jgi:antitoxin (DNA-binding transcriptional repressor) of toxin-antitoxin stability system
VKTITVRDLRQRWPVAENLLQTERELLITRDGQPVARLVRLAADRVKRRRFDPAEHRVWQTQVFGKGTTLRWIDRSLESGRRERPSGGRA